MFVPINIGESEAKMLFFNFGISYLSYMTGGKCHGDN